jgi:hypothetical protein
MHITLSALEFCCITYSLLRIIGIIRGFLNSIGFIIMFMYLKINLN